MTQQATTIAMTFCALLCTLGGVHSQSRRGLKVGILAVVFSRTTARFLAFCFRSGFRFSLFLFVVVAKYWLSLILYLPLQHNAMNADNVE